MGFTNLNAKMPTLMSALSLKFLSCESIVINPFLIVSDNNINSSDSGSSSCWYQLSAILNFPISSESIRFSVSFLSIILVEGRVEASGLARVVLGFIVL